MRWFVQACHAPEACDYTTGVVGLVRSLYSTGKGNSGRDQHTTSMLPQGASTMMVRFIVAEC